MYSSDSYLTCLSFPFIAEQRGFIDNAKSFSQLPNLRKSFRKCPYHKGLPVPFEPSIPIHPSLCFQNISGHERKFSDIVYKLGILVPPP